MQTIFLSPHFDDVALSCGGLVWQKIQAGEQVSIWTILAGNPPPGPLSEFAQKLHTRWQTGGQAVSQRQEEDISSCGILGADYRHFSVPECIYRFTETQPLSGVKPATGRQHLYTEDTYLGPIHPEDEALIKMLVEKLQNEIPDQSLIISPLAIGGHVDHRLVRAVAERTNRQILYYADYPYCIKEPHKLEELENRGWKKITYQLPDEGLLTWQKAVAAHNSQISTFWEDLNSMAEAIKAYSQQIGGSILWSKAS